MGYVVFLTMAVPVIGIALATIAILAGQISKSLLIDHFGWLGMPAKKMDKNRVIALIFIVIALVLVTMDKVA